MTGTRMVWACLCVLAAGVLAAGCAPNELVDELAELGVTPATTVRLRFIGSEADFGTTKVRVVVTNEEAIKAAWQLIQAAEPADVWHASGYRRMELYTPEGADKPVVVLLVNAGDLCHVEGSSRYYYDPDAGRMLGLFRCPGLHSLLMEALSAEHKRQQAPPR